MHVGVCDVECLEGGPRAPEEARHVNPDIPHHKHQRACRECNSSTRNKLLLPSCPPPPEIPPPFCFIHMLFFSLMDSCATFSCKLRGGTVVGCLQHTTEKKHTNKYILFHTNTQKKKQCKKKRKKTFFFFLPIDSIY